MARKHLAYISNDVVRRAAFKKRRRCLLKKVSELSTLCDVTACAVIYEIGMDQPEVFPSELEARQILQDFRTQPEHVQSKKMINHEKFLHHRVEKLKDQLTRMRRSTRELELTALIYEGLSGRGLDGIGVEDVVGITNFVNASLKAVQMRKEALHVGANDRYGSSTGLMGDGPHGSGEHGLYKGQLGEIQQPFVMNLGFGGPSKPSLWIEPMGESPVFPPNS